LPPPPVYPSKRAALPTKDADPALGRHPAIGQAPGEGGLREANDDVRARFANFVTAIALHNTRRLELARLHDEFRFLGADARARYVAKRRVVDQTLSDLLEEGTDRGVFAVDRDSDFTSRVILGMLSGIVDWYIEGGPSSPEEIAAQYVRMAQRLVGDTSAAALP